MNYNYNNSSYGGAGNHFPTTTPYPTTPTYNTASTPYNHTTPTYGVPPTSYTPTTGYGMSASAYPTSTARGSKPNIGSFRQPDFKETATVTNPLKSDGSSWKGNILPLLCYPNVNKLSTVELRLQDYYLIRTGQADQKPVEDSIMYKRFNPNLIKAKNMQFYIGERDIKQPMSITQNPPTASYNFSTSTIPTSGTAYPGASTSPHTVPYGGSSTPFGTSTPSFGQSGNMTSSTNPFGLPSTTTNNNLFGNAQAPSPANPFGIPTSGTAPSSTPTTGNTYNSSTPNIGNPFGIQTTAPTSSTNLYNSSSMHHPTSSYNSLGGSAVPATGNPFGLPSSSSTPSTTAPNPFSNMAAGSLTGTSTPSNPFSQVSSSITPGANSFQTAPAMQSSTSNLFATNPGSSTVTFASSQVGTTAAGWLTPSSMPSGSGVEYNPTTGNMFASMGAMIMPMPESQYNELLRSTTQKINESINRRKEVDWDSWMFRPREPPPEGMHRRKAQQNIIIINKHQRHAKLPTKVTDDQLYHFRVHIEKASPILFQLRVPLWYGQEQITKMIKQQLAMRGHSDSLEITFDDNIEKTIYCTAKIPCQLVTSRLDPGPDAFQVTPSIAEIKEAEHHVDSLILSNRFGRAIWPGPLYIPNLNFNEYVSIGDNFIQVYADGQSKPALGEELNRACEVTFYSERLKDLLKRNGASSLKKMLDQMVQKQGDCKLLEIDEEGHWWKIYIDHF